MSHPRIIGRRVLHLTEVGSTNDLVREHARHGEPEGLVISADAQTAGRGRLNRRWVAPPGSSVQLSVLLRPPLPPQTSHVMAQMAGLAITSTLRDLFGLEPALKWPNDVLLNSRKVAGILIETSIEADRLAYVILGIGLNVNFQMILYPDLAAAATTLSDEFGHAVDRLAVQAGLLAHLDVVYQELLAGRDLYPAWRAELITLGQFVRARTAEGEETGRAVEVTSEGGLVVQRSDGSTVTLYAGDVTLHTGG